MSATSEKMNREWKVNDAKRDAGLTTPENIVRYDDLLYGPDAKINRLDVYRPKAAEGKTIPVIVSIHGGGWVYGDKELYQFYCMSLAQRGFAVVNFTYRLAPGHKFPAQLEDTNMVMEWVFAHAGEYGLDTRNIFMVGDSAGAHLLGLYTAMCTSDAYASNYEFKVPDGFVPKAIALNCGAYEVLGGRPHEGDTMNSELILEDLLAEHGSEKEKSLINVPDHVNPDFPLVYLMTCFGDFCMDQAPVLEEKLKEKGVKYVYKIYGSEEEQLYHVFHLTVQEETGQKCNDEECAFFREQM